MRLTDVLWRFRFPLPKGHIWRGKFKLHKKVTPLIKANKIAEYDIEERNMYYLRHPYLTMEQTRGHAKSFNHKEKFFSKHYEKRLDWRNNELLGDRFGFLKVSEKWEE